MTETSIIPSYSMPNDIDLSQRLAAFNSDGRLASNSSEIKALIANSEAMIAKNFIEHYLKVMVKDRIVSEQDIAPHVKESVAYIQLKYGNASEPAWVKKACDMAAFLRKSGCPLSCAVAGFANSHEVTISCIAKACDGDFDTLRRLSSTVMKLGMMEAEIAAWVYAQFDKAEDAETREQITHNFEGTVSTVLREASSFGKRVGTQSAGAAKSAQMMLGKASEVAAAAQQSAFAMREAATTANGLIKAIENSQVEVDSAAQVVTRAAEQASHASSLSQTLSGHAEAIESIIGLIRDVAGQTNLLALNATIEAARAGDAGRGFAVVAQEVKSLASQTAQATDDIAAKISAIQISARSTLDANGAIHDIMQEVQKTAERIRTAMEVQTQTVTRITSAVDETALAADAMSGSIGAICAETENMSREIAELSTGFGEVDSKLVSLEAAASNFRKQIAA